MLSCQHNFSTMKLSSLLFALLIFSLVACKGSKKSTEEKKEVVSAEQKVEKDMSASPIKSLAVKRNACFGQCPAFEFTVDNTGACTYHGKRFVDQLGIWKGQVGTDVLEELWNYCDSLDLATYGATYKSGAMDAPISSLKIGRTDSVQTIVGDFAMPDEIKVAMSYLDSMCQQAVPTFELFEANVPRGIVPGETIVNVKADGSPEAICRSFAEYGLKMKKKVSPALSLYVLTFDENQNAGRLLALLKKHPMVIEAQFNQSADQRNN